MTDQAIMELAPQLACGPRVKQWVPRRPATTDATGKARHRSGQSQYRIGNGGSRVR